MCQAIVEGRYDFPSVIRREVSPHNQQPLWEYWSIPARHHFGPHGGCAYVAWVNAGQNGSLGAVSCDGATGVRNTVVRPDIPAGRVITVPPHIDCGMGTVLAQVEDWAWAERDQVYYRLPLFDRHDVGELETAHDELIEIGGRLALQADSGSDDRVRGSFNAIETRVLPATVRVISGDHSLGKDWWTGWTGLTASRAKGGFFASTVPTLNNQSGIVGALANLYSDRAAIIEKGRNDALYWIQWATDSLGETEMVTTDRTSGWKAVQGIGQGITVAGTWSAAASGPMGVGVTAVGVTITLVGFLGENIDSGGRTEQYAHGIEQVVERLNDEVDALNSQLDGYENDYYRAVIALRNTIHGIHSFNLELYDLTQNNPLGEVDRGADRGGGYDADLDSILGIAEKTYDAGSYYEALLPRIADTSHADRHLANKDGNPTHGDRGLLEVRDRFEGFLKTSCGRYLVAGDHVRRAAEAYVEVETQHRHKFDRTMEDWEDKGVGEVEVEFDPQRYARPTDRSGYDPWQRHPARGGGRPGAGDGEDYVVEGQ